MTCLREDNKWPCSLSPFRGSISGRRKARVRPFGNDHDQDQTREHNQPDLAATCKVTLTPISDVSCSLFSEFVLRDASVIICADGVRGQVHPGLAADLRPKTRRWVSLAGGFLSKLATSKIAHLMCDVLGWLQPAPDHIEGDAR